MAEFIAPIRDMKFVVEELIGLETVLFHAKCQEDGSKTFSARAMRKATV